MKWFRLYSDLRHDPKIQNLRPELFKFWINLLCLANDRPKRNIPSLDHILCGLGMRQDYAARFIRELEAIGLVIARGGGWDVMILRPTDNGRLSADQWIPLRAAILERDDHTCQYCGETGVPMECDHVIPVSREGSNDPSNLVAACAKCNRSKRDKLVEEWTQ